MTLLKEITLIVAVDEGSMDDQEIIDFLSSGLSSKNCLCVRKILIKEKLGLNEKTDVGKYVYQGDGSYRLYTGEERGWILCDGYLSMLEELNKLEEMKDGIESKN